MEDSLQTSMEISQVIGESEFGSLLSILGLIITISVFIYQERGKRQEKTKETMRLTEELVNLIVRNSISNGSGIPFRSINLTYFLEGYKQLKNSEMKEDNIRLSKMVYAKIYENEHIANNVREQMLIEVKDIIEEFEERANSKRKNLGVRGLAKLLFSLVLVTALVILIFVLPSWMRVLVQTDTLSGALKVTIFIILFLLALVIIPIIINILIKPLVTEVDNLLDIADDHWKRGKNNKNNKNNTRCEQSSSNEPVIKPAQEKSSEERLSSLNLKRFINDETILVETFKHRFMLEQYIREIFTRKFEGENYYMRYPISKLLNQLIYDEIIDKEIGELAKKLYSLTSRVIHEGDRDIDQVVYQDTIASMNRLLQYFEDLLSKW
ncbi:hypothetical protein [Bacillus mycoides]|uniref:Uncharacterized protein n=1 Tax=Bacillus mycoides (strain KBAB4) TaxID=315730 RepID=A9VJZ0_BACMK|nr:hypothetical protein [Bacillus mycoides]ABY42426.1 hypothetical protein BcerKBAB4_1178 [Bacillus mycoides KBAB4]